MAGEELVVVEGVVEGAVVVRKEMWRDGGAGHEETVLVMGGQVVITGGLSGMLCRRLEGAGTPGRGGSSMPMALWGETRVACWWLGYS